MEETKIEEKPELKYIKCPYLKAQGCSDEYVSSSQHGQD